MIAVTRLAWRPREHTRDPHVEDDRVQKEGELQPRLAPLRVHEGGVHGDLYRNSSSKMPWTCSIVDRPKNRLFGPGDESAVLLIVLHTSSVLVTVRASKRKKAKINSDRKIIMAIFPEFGGLLKDPGHFSGLEVELKKRWPVIILAPMVHF